MEKDTSFGSISEWNEGNFKTLRLHESQELINMGKMNPFEYSEDGTKWNYVIWKSGIDILYGEGQSKYGEPEIKEIDCIKTLSENLIELFPPFKILRESKYFGNENKFIPIKKNQSKIKKYLELYEKQVKIYNDAHGLSTRNKDDDLRGL